MIPGTKRREVDQDRMQATPRTHRALTPSAHLVLFARLTRADIVASFDDTIDYRLHYHFSPTDLAAWPGKVLILQSDDDPATNPTMRLALRTLYPQAQVRTFQRVGHTPFLSQPGEFYPVVRAFLQQL